MSKNVKTALYKSLQEMSVLSRRHRKRSLHPQSSQNARRLLNARECSYSHIDRIFKDLQVHVITDKN